jgi:Domain of unknown function (DUF4386)
MIAALTTTERIHHRSPGVNVRTAGVLYFAAVLIAVFAEFIAPGRLATAVAVVVPVACYAAVTLLLYAIFRPVNGRVALLALLSGLIGLAFEALRFQPRSINLGMTFHALYCLAIGWLMFRSGFLPRHLGALMIFAGLVWLLYLSPPLANHIAPYNTAAGLLGEAVPMLWLLIMGASTQRSKEQSR